MRLLPYTWLHKLFGWDYAVINFGMAQYICRVHRPPKGDPYILFCGTYFNGKGARTWRPLTFEEVEYAS